MPWLTQHSVFIDIAYRHTFADTRNVVFTGMLYICAGALIALHQDKLHIPFPALLLMALLSLVGLTLVPNELMWTICCTIFVILIIEIAIYHKATQAYPSMRLWGVAIYLLHVYVLKVIQFLTPRLGFTIIDINVTNMIFASICSLLLACVLTPITRNHKSLKFLFHG